MITEILSSKDISKWNEGKIQIAIAHHAATGHGLNFKAGGSTIIWFWLTWSLEFYQQVNAGLERQEQKGIVVIHHIASKEIIDE